MSRHHHTGDDGADEARMVEFYDAMEAIENQVEYVVRIDGWTRRILSAVAVTSFLFVLYELVRHRRRENARGRIYLVEEEVEDVTEKGEGKGREVGKRAVPL